MILDKIGYRAFYSDNPKLKAILDYMATISPESFPKQKTDLIDDEAFVNPVCLSTKAESECIFEAHQKYADIHYIVEGSEKIIVDSITNVTVVTPYDESKDIGFHNGNGGTVCVLNPGDFLVCYPHDAHKVAIMVDTVSPVKKLVGKLKVDAN